MGIDVIIKKEINHSSLFDKWFIITGVLLQLSIGILTHSTVVTIISGVSGIFAVILCAQRKLIQFPFSFIQLFTYVILAFEQRFYGELIENGFYFITMLMGMYWWWKGYDSTSSEINVKKLSLTMNYAIIFANIVVITILYIYLLKQTDDTQPFLDAVSTVPAFTAQILLMTRYRENWIYWLIIDIASIIMWMKAGNIVMAIQFIFWSINCLYGLKKWKYINNDVFSIT